MMRSILVCRLPVPSSAVSIPVRECRVLCFRKNSSDVEESRMSMVLTLAVLDRHGFCPSFLTSELYGDEWSASRPSHLTPKKEPLVSTG
jgi:hypothetical protein